MQRILLTKLLHTPPGFQFDGTAVKDIYSQRLENNIDGNSGLLFSRQALGYGTLGDGSARRAVCIGDANNKIAIGKRLTDIVNVVRTVGGSTTSIDAPYTTEGEYYANGIAWDGDDITHIKPDGTEETAVAGVSLPGAAAYIGGETPASNLWMGLVSHVALFFEAFDAGERTAVWQMFSGGDITAEEIDIQISRKFVLWTLYPHLQYEEWGSDTVL